MVKPAFLVRLKFSPHKQTRPWRLGQLPVRQLRPEPAVTR
jgi:hypothetical protein